MAKRGAKHGVDDEAPVLNAAEDASEDSGPAAEPVIQAKNPSNTAYLEGIGYIDVEEPFQRRINHNGQNFEHTHEDAYGVWVYRAM